MEEALQPPSPAVEWTVIMKRAAVVNELKKVCYIAMPMVVVNVSLNLLRVGSMSMVGHLGELELAGTALATSLTNVTGFSLLFGMASALETLCGRAYGARQYQKLGTYTYGAIISLLLVCFPLSLLWIFMDKLLILLGQDPLISAEAQKFSICLIPTLFPYSILQVIIRYLLTQSLILPMLVTSLAALLLHIPVCWALVIKLELGNAGAALSIGLSYSLNVILLGIYVKYSSACDNTRVLFSKDVYPSIREFFRFAVPSTVMTCLEWWTYELVILLSGLLPNPKLETSVLSICLAITTLHFLIPSSFASAASARVSNELGAGNPEGAKLAVQVVAILATIEAIVAASALFCFRSVLGYAFGNGKELVDYVKDITPLICISIVEDCATALLNGVARGSGWQRIGAYINLGAYYLVGIPVALIMGFVLQLKGEGLWIGLIAGSLGHIILLALVTIFSNWQEEASKARGQVFDRRIPDIN